MHSNRQDQQGRPAAASSSSAVLVPGRGKHRGNRGGPAARPWTGEGTRPAVEGTPPAVEGTRWEHSLEVAGRRLVAVVGIRHMHHPVVGRAVHRTRPVVVGRLPPGCTAAQGPCPAGGSPEGDSLLAGVGSPCCLRC